MALRQKRKGEINASESQLWVSNRGVDYSPAALYSHSLLVVQGHPSEPHQRQYCHHFTPHIWYHGNWVMWFPSPYQKLLARYHMGISPLRPRSSNEQKEKQVRSSAESLLHGLRWVLMIVGTLVWLSADSVQARLHCAPSAFQSHLNSCQCLIIPPFPS